MDPDDLDPDPHLQFDRWFAEAAAAGVTAPEQMALATAGADGRPSVRMVLLKGHDERGFVFYTNRESRKAAELDANPWAAQRCTGRSRAARCGSREPSSGSATTSRSRTSTRGPARARSAPGPRRSQSPSPTGRSWSGGSPRSSSALTARTVLPLPPFWGGYRIVAAAIEFWQGRPNRLHDRVRYELDGGAWNRERLGP